MFLSLEMIGKKLWISRYLVFFRPFSTSVKPVKTISSKAVSTACCVVFCNHFVCSRTTFSTTMYRIWSQTWGNNLTFGMVAKGADRSRDVKDGGWPSRSSKGNAWFRVWIGSCLIIPAPLGFSWLYAVWNDNVLIAQDASQTASRRDKSGIWPSCTVAVCHRRRSKSFLS